jgi:dihydroneopterin aldolase
MDKVFIRGLSIEAVIGVFEWEKQVQQPLIFDLEMDWDITQAAETDDLQYALNYAAVTDRVIEFVQANQYDLLERLLVQLAETLRQEFSIPKIKIRVEKPAVAPHAQAVGLEIERG